MNRRVVNHDPKVGTTSRRRPPLSRQIGQRNLGGEEIVLVDFLPTRFATHHLWVEAVEQDCEQSVFGGSTDSPRTPCSRPTTATTISVKKHKKQKNKKKSKHSRFHACGSTTSLHLSSRSFFESSGSTLSSISEEPHIEDQERNGLSGMTTRCRMMDSIGLEDDALPKNAKAIGCGFHVVLPDPQLMSSSEAMWDDASPWDCSFADDGVLPSSTMDEYASSSRCGSSVVKHPTTSTEFVVWPSFVAMETPQEITVVNDDCWSHADDEDTKRRPPVEQEDKSAHNNQSIVRPGTFRKREPHVTSRTRRSKDTTGATGPSMLCQPNYDIPVVCTGGCPLTPVSEASTKELECSPCSIDSTSGTPKIRNRKIPARTFHRLAMALPWRRSMVSSCDVSNEV